MKNILLKNIYKPYKPDLQKNTILMKYKIHKLFNRGYEATNKLEK